MDLKLINKNAIVCASSQGLGRAAAIDLALEGVNLAICSRDQKKIERTKDEIIKRTGNKVKVFAYEVDLDSPEDIERFYEDATNNLGSIDILINSLNEISNNYVKIDELIIGGENSDWSIEEHEDLVFKN